MQKTIVLPGAWGVRGTDKKTLLVFYPPCLKDYVFITKRASPPGDFKNYCSDRSMGGNESLAIR